MNLEWNQYYWDWKNEEWKTRRMQYYTKDIFKTIEGKRCVLGEGEICGSSESKPEKCWILIDNPNFAYYHKDNNVSE